MTYIYYTEVNTICIMLLVILNFSIVKLHKGVRDKLYLTMLYSAISMCAADMVAGVHSGSMFEGASIILWASNIIYFLTTFVLSYCWVLYSMRVLTGRINKKIAAPVGIATAAAALIIAFAPVNGWVFTIDETNVYHRGPYLWIHWLFVYPSIIIPSVIAPFTKAPDRKKQAVEAFSILPMLTALLQTMIYGISVSQVGVTGSIMMLYVMLQSDAVNEATMRAQLMNELSNTDPLTGLRNRRAYNRRLDELIRADWVGVVFADFNGLKLINDKYGHKEGDKKLREFANVLLSYFTEEEVFRISGDEFVVLITDPVHFDDRKDKAKRDIIPYASSGMGYGKGSDLHSVITKAENEMYEEKNEYHRIHGSARN